MVRRKPTANSASGAPMRAAQRLLSNHRFRAFTLPSNCGAKVPPCRPYDLLRTSYVLLLYCILTLASGNVLRRDDFSRMEKTGNADPLPADLDNQVNDREGREEQRQRPRRAGEMDRRIFARSDSARGLIARSAAPLVRGGLRHSLHAGREYRADEILPHRDPVIERGRDVNAGQHEQQLEIPAVKERQPIRDLERHEPGKRPLRREVVVREQADAACSKSKISSAITIQPPSGLWPT